MKILFCPSHYALLDDRGSELEWAYKITHSIATLYPDSVAVTGFSNVVYSSYKIVTLQKNQRSIDLGIINTIKFALQYGIEGIRQLTSEHFDIHHHVLPFYLGRTFNLAFLVPIKNKPIRIIGPIQNPLPFFADNLDDQSQTLILTKQITNFLSKLFIDAVGVLLSKLSYATLKSADAILVIDASLKTVIVKKGIDESKVHIIPPGVDVHKHTSLKERETKLKSRKHINIISTGALIKRKGFDLLIKSIAEVRRLDKTISFHVDIYGDGPQRNNLELQISSAGLSSFITLHGLVDHDILPDKYAQADIFISMTRADSFAQMYLEAMSSGLPIISTINPGSKTVIKKGANGYLVEKNGYGDMAEHIVNLAKNKELLQTMKINSQKIAAQYDWSTSIIPQYLAIYKKLIRSRVYTTH